MEIYDNENIFLEGTAHVWNSVILKIQLFCILCISEVNNSNACIFLGKKHGMHQQEVFFHYKTYCNAVFHSNCLSFKDV